MGAKWAGSVHPGKKPLITPEGFAKSTLKILNLTKFILRILNLIFFYPKL